MEAVKLLDKVSPWPLPPFMLDEHFYDTLAEAPPQDQNSSRPLPSWTFAKKTASGIPMPQTIAHRGYKANFPENTMGAFKGAAEVGAHAIETDVHLTKDGVVVLSHDADLKRCFGKKYKLIDRRWEEIKDLQTLETPHQTMPRLQDLLEFLALPETNENIWVLLDIKPDNDASDNMRLIAATIKTVTPHPKRPWNQRIVLGCWAAKYLPLCAEYLPSFSVTNIAFSTAYARQFLHTPNVSFNMILQSLLVPYFGSRFLKEVRRKGRPVYTWTVNDEDRMRLTIRKGLDGVCTDNPKRFLEVCDEWEQGHRTISIGRQEWSSTAWFQLLICVFGAIFWWKHGDLDRSQVVPPPRGTKAGHKFRKGELKMQKMPVA